MSAFNWLGAGMFAVPVLALFVYIGWHNGAAAAFKSFAVLAACLAWIGVAAYLLKPGR